MKTILVPVDFSEVSAKTAATAFSLVQDIHVRIVFLHVTVATATISDAEAMLKLESLVRSARDRGIVATWRLVRGSAVSQILARAEELYADIIVMGSHDRESTHGSSIGSTASGVLAVTPCPIVIVPSEKAKAESVRRRELFAVSAAG